MRCKSPATAVSVVHIKGPALWKALGFASERAFQRARQTKRVALPLYPIPGQARGVYARSDELAEYLASHHPNRRRHPMKT